MSSATTSATQPFTEPVSTAPIIAKSPARAQGQAAARPNIVVFYIDDVPPHDGRLWGDPMLTPTLHDAFVAQGLNFVNAVGETSLCCPARASLLTGQHTHNHGVLVNDARLFDPSEHIGRAMKESGYATMFVGKYLNHNHLLTADQWLAHGRGWTQLDAIVSLGTGFFNYEVHTKQGTLSYTGHHSTRMATERTILHMRSTPEATPIFAVISMFNMHGPNYPMPEFKNDPRCDGMDPWNPPNYNEADVSDKPAIIQALPLQPNADGWRMVGHCKEAMSIDWAVEQITDELRSQGRLDDTLLVFTGDNGTGWGAHRIGQEKGMPYTTPVPLYMSWPARWGAAPRQISDVVSNIDLAPTFCAIGGCSLDSYPGGQPQPDGVDLLPLLDGEVESLARDAVLESNWEPSRRWAAVRTDATHPLGPWHYVEYRTGERELYDLQADEWELQNVAGDPGLSGIQATLARTLAELRQRGARPRVDATVGVMGGDVMGAHYYRPEPVFQQTLKRRGLARGATQDFTVRIWNRGGAADSVSVSGQTSGSTDIAVTYLVGGADVTASVESGTYVTPALPIQGSVAMIVRMTVASTAPSGARRRAEVLISSSADPTKLDVVKVVGIR